VTTSLKRQQKSQDKQQKSHEAYDRIEGETPSTDDYLKVLEVFKINQSPDDSSNNSQLEHLK